MTNKCQIGAVRGVGWVPGQLAREVAIDQLARELGQDPVEIRLKNMLGPEVHTTAFGHAYDGGATPRPSRRPATPSATRASGSGNGTPAPRAATSVSASAPSSSRPVGRPRARRRGGLPNGYYDMASVTVEPDGSVTVTTGLHSHGQGHETTLAQITADELGVAMDSVRVVFGDTDTSAFGMGSYASRSAVVGYGTIQASAVKVAIA